jgi:hypothetical protein
MMHRGWALEQGRWEEGAAGARSVYGLGDAMTHLEDWIALDYPPDSPVRPCTHASL